MTGLDEDLQRTVSFLLGFKGAGYIHLAAWYTYEWVCVYVYTYICQRITFKCHQFKMTVIDGMGHLPLFSWFSWWLDGNCHVIRKSEVTSFPALGRYSHRGQSRQTNKQTEKDILTHHGDFWSERLSSLFSLNEEYVGQHLLAKLL